MAKITTVVVTCDRCGKEQFETPLWMGWSRINILKRNCRKITFSNVPWDSDWRFHSEIELCNECLESMREWFEEGRHED